MAGDYGTVDKGLWRHHEFKVLDDDSKLLALYVRTCDHMNMIGCFLLPLLYIAADLNWTLERVKQTLPKLFAKGFVTYDFDVEYALISRHLDKFPLQNPNQAKGAIRLYRDIPSKFKYIKDIEDILNRSESVKKAFPKGFLRVANTVTVTVTNSHGDKSPDKKDYIWTTGLQLPGITRSFIGKQIKEYSEDEVAAAIARTVEHQPADPKSFLVGCLKNRDIDPAAALGAK